MANQVGVIDTALIKQKEDESKRKHQKSKRHHQKDEDYDPYKKPTPLPVLMARDAERRKNMQKAKLKAKQKTMKAREAKYGPVKHSKHRRRRKEKYDTYEVDSSDDDDDIKLFASPRSGFSNGGNYRIKNGGMAFGKRG